MRRTPVTLGILSIVFGSLVALSNVLKLAVSVLSPTLIGHMGTLMKNLPQRPGQPDPALVMARTAEAMHQVAPYNDALTGGKLALSIALIVIGCGMYQRRRWSRSGALGWGVLALLFTFVEAIVMVSIVIPRTAAVMKDVMASDPATLQLAQSTQSMGTLLLTILLYSPFPLVLLALCGRRSAAADFTD